MSKDNPFFQEEYDANAPKKIGDDFVLVKLDNGEWAMQIIIGEKKAFCGANQYEVALWKARDAMYGLFSKIYAAASTKDPSGVAIRAIIETSRLDLGKIILKEKSNGN